MQDEKVIHYDIRVVRMAKSTEKTNLNWVLTQMRKLDEKWTQENQPVNLNLCLGHFDVMVIDQLEENDEDSLGPMDRVIKDYNCAMDLRGMLGAERSTTDNSECSNYYPLYMLVQSDSNADRFQDKLNQYWKEKHKYTVVMRLHQGHSAEKENFRKILEERLKEANEVIDSSINVNPCEDIVFDLTVSKGETPYHVYSVFYDSLELSDVVCILRGDSLQMILEVQRWLYESKHVSDAYSYCGIDYRIFTNGTDSDTDCLVNNSTGTNLDYVETRFSVRSSDLAWEYLSDTLKYEGYFVTGSADALLHYSDISESEFLDNIKALICYDKMYQAFHDVVTRVGLKNRKPPGNRDSTNTPDKSITLDQTLVSWLAEKYGKTNHPDGKIYAYSLEQLVSSLNSMRTNSVTDALSELMYEGIEALLEQLQFYQSQNKWTKNHSISLQGFLDEWTAATNEILHLESQLFQHPELIPVRYYIPAMILQFQRLIVQKAMEAVDDIDQSSGYRYVPIIFPKSQDTTATKAILDPRDEKEYSGPSPLCIHVPIHMLYHPYRISLILCHEIAHYCGNTIRNRSMRNEMLLNCLAFYASVQMTDYLGVLDVDTDYTEVICERALNCKDEMCRYIQAILPVDTADQYLEDTIHMLWENMEYLTEPTVVNAVVDTILAGFTKDIGAQRRICAKVEVDGHRRFSEYVSLCRAHLEDCLENLFRECFADIVMILLSDCSFKDYYMCLFHDEFRNLENSEDRSHWFEHHTDRMALVASSINSINAGWCVTYPSGREDYPWQRITRQKVKAWDAQRNHSGLKKWHREYPESINYAYALLGYEAELLLDYLKTCTHDIHGKIVTDSQRPKIINAGVAQLRKRISLMKRNRMDWNELQKILLQAR